MINNDPQNYVKNILEDNRVFLSKTITLIESTKKTDIKLSQRILDLLPCNSSKAIRIGITGIPGVGKSTFIESFGIMLVKQGYKLAVLAVDPSSNISGGSIMADKTRMVNLSKQPNAFIRPSPSRGNLGGVSKMTRESITVCEAAGFDIIIVETVGVGQSETAVASMVDFFLVLMLSGAGDELQGIKKGVLELADALVINKADGDNILKATESKQLYENAFKMLNHVTPGWSPPVLTCSSILPLGFEKIWETITTHHKILSENGELDKKRTQQSLDWMQSRIEHGIIEYFLKSLEMKTELAKVSNNVKKGLISPSSGAEKILSLFKKK